METLFYHRNTCRLCESPQVELVVKMIPCPPVDAYIPFTQISETQPSFPMDLYLCHECGHAQLLDVVSPKILFGSYIYTTASSPGLVDYFRDYAASVCGQLQFASGALAVDIGSNDGTLLSFIHQHGFRVLGVDPAKQIAAEATAKGINTLPSFFTRVLAENIRMEYGPVNLVTANNVFAHSDMLGDMADGIRILLAPDGVFVFEVSYLLDVIDNMLFDVIYHEHLSYHSVKPLQRFLKQHGLHLFRIERTPSKGGTLRCFAQLSDGPRAEDMSVKMLLHLEEERGLYQRATYQRFFDRIKHVKGQVQAALSALSFEGKTCAGYGASATATVLTYQFEIGNSLRTIIDDNPIRQNRYSPGFHIPVVSSQALLENPPDCVVILVWRFAEMIIQRNSAYQKRGGQFIIPLPEMRIV